MNYKETAAMITGASSGLGEEFARQLAAQGAGLVLVARSRDKLETLAESLRKQFRVNVTVMQADLSSTEEVSRLVEDVKCGGLRIDLLINNAGLGIFENFLGTPLETQMQEIDVNVRALVALTHALAQGMVAAGRGGVINIASSAAFQPLAGANVYAATKAFVLFFSEALSLELKGSGVHVMASCPGPVATKFFDKMKPKQSAEQMDQPEKVVRDTLRAFAAGKRVAYPGKLIVRLGTWGARLMPRNLILHAAARNIRRLNQKS